MAYKCSLRIRGYHCDAYGHVNNARYLELFEEARWRALDESGVGKIVLDHGLLFFVVQINVSFKLPVENDDNISISTVLHDHTRRTLSFKQTIFRGDGTTSTEALVTFVLFDPESQASVRIDEVKMDWFSTFIDGTS